MRHFYRIVYFVIYSPVLSAGEVASPKNGTLLLKLIMTLYEPKLVVHGKCEVRYFIFKI